MRIRGSLNTLQRGTQHILLSKEGRDAVQAHFYKLIALMKASVTWEQMVAMVDRVMPKQGATLLLPLMSDPSPTPMDPPNVVQSTSGGRRADRYSVSRRPPRSTQPSVLERSCTAGDSGRPAKKAGGPSRAISLLAVSAYAGSARTDPPSWQRESLGRESETAPSGETSA